MRLNIERQNDLQPKRIKSCKEKLESMGFKITFESETELNFLFEGEPVRFFPYSGWHTGKHIKDGRGFSKLLRQIKK